MTLFRSMLSTLAGMAGAIAFGFVSDKMFDARRPPVNLIFAVLELIGLVITFFGPHNVPVLIAGMLLFGMGLTGLVTSLGGRSEEHTSELQSLMRISYAVFCLKKKK